MESGDDQNIVITRLVRRSLPPASEKIHTFAVDIGAYQVKESVERWVGRCLVTSDLALDENR